MFLTVAFGSILQTEGDGQHGVVLKELCGEGIPPQVVALLQRDTNSPVTNTIAELFPESNMDLRAYEPLSSSVAAC